MDRLSLFRYNFRVLTHNNWWLLVFPLAASQLTVFWNLITQRFAEALPARSVEMVTPLLAAFLSAHLLSAEYRTGMGAILACKPMHIGKVVLRRLAVVLALVWALGALSLLAYFYGMQPYGMATPAVAGAASSLFLAVLALTFATLLRNPLAGFGVAALYWAVDLPGGPAINPYLSLQTLSASLQPPDVLGMTTMPGPWWIAKLVLLAGAAVLYHLHGRMLFGLGTAPSARQRRRAMGWAVGLFVLYLGSGAALKVGYGFTHRGRLAPDDGTWFRRQFASFGPIPATYLFGGAFRRYVGEIPNAWRIQSDDESDRWGNTVRHRRELEEVVRTMPDSIWAPSALELLARMDGGGAVERYRRLVSTYPNSPYLALALERMARLQIDDQSSERSRAAYRELLARCPGSPYEAEALRFLAETDRRRGDLASAEQRARAWARVAPVTERFWAHLMLAELLVAQRRPEEGRREAERVQADVSAFNRACASGEVNDAGKHLTKWKQDAAIALSRARELLGRMGNAPGRSAD